MSFISSVSHFVVFNRGFLKHVSSDLLFVFCALIYLFTTFLNVLLTVCVKSCKYINKHIVQIKHDKLYLNNVLHHFTGCLLDVYKRQVVYVGPSLFGSRQTTYERCSSSVLLNLAAIPSE